MNKSQKEILQAYIDAEKKELKELEAIYKQAVSDIDDRLAKLLGRADSDMSQVIYQVEYQKALKTQINGILDDLHGNEFQNITEYLNECYNNGYIGTMYDIAKQGIPIIAPIDANKVAKALTIDSKISKGLYEKLGEDVAMMKKRIASSISRGIAAGQSYSEMARNIMADSNVGFNRAMRIARTEGGRIQSQASFDAQQKAADSGADVVKQWDASLDGKTRESHRKLDGQIRELDEPFEVDGKTAMFPHNFGIASEDINCRCALLQRARWALDEDELQELKDRAKVMGIDKPDDFGGFKNKYIRTIESPVLATSKFVPAKTIEEATRFANDLGVKYAVFDDLPLETANWINEALLTLPKDARPVFVGSSKQLEYYANTKLSRSSKRFYGVSYEALYVHTGANVWDVNTYGNMIAISSYYKTADRITAAKLIAQEAYITKHGTKWFYNTNGRATAFHEMGHAYANKYGIPKGFEDDAKRWAKETGCDMLKKTSEAWAEAWGAYHTNDPDLPEYISKYIEEVTENKIANILKSSKISLKDVYDKLPDGTAKMYAKQTEKQLLQGMRKEQKMIDLHLDKIANPEKYVDGWETRNEQYKKGIINKWEKDIKNHRLQVQLRKDELARRKD